MDFNSQQLEALDRVAKWYRDWTPNGPRPFFYLAGYAGTGKTTLATHLTEGITGEIQFAAFTGKAASVLRTKGCPNARTLHSLMYSVTEGDEELVRQITEALMDPDLTEKERKALTLKLREAKKEAQRPRFTRNPFGPIATCAILVIDESSMLNGKLAEDALAYKRPILVLGDPAQLPPVKGAGYFTSHKPHMLLTEIHRQAADNPILRWSKIIREGGKIPYSDEGRARHIPKGQLDFATLDPHTQVLTGRNRVRRRLNSKMRTARGFTSTLPQAGDKLVCLKNNNELGLLNGVICTAMSDAMRLEDDMLSMDVLFETLLLDDLPVAALPFDLYADPTEEDAFISRHLEQFDYGYALTVHKSQGSQWENVVLADDHFASWDPGMRRKWLYTAVTRASENLTIVS